MTQTTTPSAHPLTGNTAARHRRTVGAAVTGSAFEDEVTRIGSGPLGTKVEGLLRISGEIQQRFGEEGPGRVRVRIPHMHVVATDYFDRFMTQNRLSELPFEHLRDEDIAEAFIDATLPSELILRLYSVVEYHTAPLAIRASRLTALPFSHGGNDLSHCKIIPNNQGTLEERVSVLKDAIKLTYASSFFRGYRDYLSCVGESVDKEKTAIIIQEVVGARHGSKFFPTISGTIHSCNFYPQQGGGLYDGSASLTFGLKNGCIADKDKPWCYALGHPEASVPFNNARHKMTATQNDFFAVDLSAEAGKMPLEKCEYIVRGSLSEAEIDPAFSMVASTYVASNDRFVPGTGNSGPRVVDFAPLLALKIHPFNETLKAILETVEDALYDKVAIEFAANHNTSTGAIELQILQVTPLFLHTMRVGITEERLHDDDIVISSTRALGNGLMDGIADIVYLVPETFDTEIGHLVAHEVEAVNRELVAEGRPYIFIAMGRIGTSDPFRGLQVAWHQISGARVFVETDLPNLPASFSGGNHFFSDLVSCGSFYFYAPLKGELSLDFNRLAAMPLVKSGRYIKHVRSETPLKIMVDGRTQRGTIALDTDGALL